VDLIEAYAEELPFSYDARKMLDLAPSMARQYLDPEHRVDAWVRAVRAAAGTNKTLNVLIAITHGIKEQSPTKPGTRKAPARRWKPWRWAAGVAATSPCS